MLSGGWCGVFRNAVLVVFQDKNALLQNANATSAFGIMPRIISSLLIRFPRSMCAWAKYRTIHHKTSAHSCDPVVRIRRIDQLPAVSVTQHRDAGGENQDGAPDPDASGGT
jgi:hypothetical protein